MAKIIIEPKRGHDGQIDYVVTYQDIKTDNQFVVTTTSDEGGSVVKTQRNARKRSPRDGK